MLTATALKRNSATIDKLPAPSEKSNRHSTHEKKLVINARRMREGYCSQFVCVFVADLVPAYDACATNSTYQSGLR